jgi:hypothetical protein
MRALAGILAGLVAGFAATILIGIVGIGMTYTPPAGASASNPAEVMATFAAMPTAAKVALMFAWFGGGLAGAAVAKLIARRAWAAWTVTLLIGAYVVLNSIVLPLPAWMQALSIAAPLIGGLIGNHLVRDRAAAAATDAAPAGVSVEGNVAESGNVPESKVDDLD